jgi:hypothetical protein
MVALLGRCDGPPDGVGDYCTYLGATLGLHGYLLEIVRVPWPERGWGAALADLRQTAADWRGCCVLLQYTTLEWSRRGFPLRFLHALRHNGARCVIVFTTRYLMVARALSTACAAPASFGCCLLDENSTSPFSFACAA